MGIYLHNNLSHFSCQYWVKGKEEEGVDACPREECLCYNLSNFVVKVVCGFDLCYPKVGALKGRDFCVCGVKEN